MPRRWWRDLDNAIAVAALLYGAPGLRCVGDGGEVAEDAA